MRKWTLILSLGASLVSVAFSSTCKGVEERVRRHLGEGLSVVVKKESSLPPYHCEVLLRAGAKVIPAFVFPDFVFVGDKIVERKSVAREMVEGYREVFVRELLSALSKLNYVSYKPENAKEGRYFYFVSDPDCPFCNRIKERVKELAERYGWEVRLVWYPLPIHEGAKEKAVSFLCENRKFEDYLKGNYGKRECEKGRREVERSIDSLSFYIYATPTFVFPDGKVVVGADEKGLEEALRR